MARGNRPEVPEVMLRQIGRVLDALPECRRETAWVGVQWRVASSSGSANVAHVFGGEDQLFRVVFRAEPDEVMAMQHLGHPYFRAGWGRNIVGMLLDDDTDWEELGELLTDSYCVQAPKALAQRVPRPG